MANKWWQLLWPLLMGWSYILISQFPVYFKRTIWILILIINCTMFFCLPRQLICNCMLIPAHNLVALNSGRYVSRCPVIRFSPGCGRSLVLQTNGTSEPWMKETLNNFCILIFGCKMSMKKHWGRSGEQKRCVNAAWEYNLRWCPASPSAQEVAACF